MIYNPKEYWQERGRRYIHQERKEELYNLERCIRKYLPEDKKILEVGSGNGWIYSFLKNRGLDLNGRFAMCDFVDSFRTACEKKTGILPDRWNGKKLAYDDNEFYFVISFSVMLHVLPFEIEGFIEEHVRVTEKYLFIATWYTEGNIKQAGDYCFVHEYPTLFKEKSLRIIKEMNCFYPERLNWLLEKV